MSVFQSPLAAGKELREYLVIGHTDGVSIVQSAGGDLYYALMDSAMAPAGTYAEAETLRPIRELPAVTQQKILQMIGGAP